MAGFCAWNLLVVLLYTCFTLRPKWNTCSVNLINTEHSCHKNSISSMLTNSSMSFVNFYFWTVRLNEILISVCSLKPILCPVLRFWAMSGIYRLLAHLPNDKTSTYRLHVFGQMIYNMIPIWQIIMAQNSYSGEEKDDSVQCWAVTIAELIKLSNPLSILRQK